MGKTEKATAVLIEALNNENLMVRVHALNSIEVIGGEVAEAAVPKVKEMIGTRKGRDYDIRAGRRLIALYE